MGFVSLFVALSVSTVPALALTPAQATANPSAGEQTDANKMVCKREEKIGTRLGGKKVCLTVQEWLERERASKEATDQWQRTGYRDPVPKGDIILPPNH